MDERIHVKWVAQGRWHGVPQQVLFDLVVAAMKVDANAPKDVQPFEHTTNVGIDRKRRSVERTHHHAGCAFRPDLRERAKKVPCLVVLPLGRGIQSAPPEPFDKRSQRELQTARFSAAETREADDLLDRKSTR